MSPSPTPHDFACPNSHNLFVWSARSQRLVLSVRPRAHTHKCRITKGPNGKSVEPFGIWLRRKRIYTATRVSPVLFCSPLPRRLVVVLPLFCFFLHGDSRPSLEWANPARSSPSSTTEARSSFSIRFPLLLSVLRVEWRWVPLFPYWVLNF